MLLTAESGGQTSTVNSPHLAIVENEPDRFTEIAESLSEHPYRLSGYSRAAETVRALRDGDRFALLILGADSEGKSRTELRSLAQELGIPVLEVLESVAD